MTSRLLSLRGVLTGDSGRDIAELFEDEDASTSGIEMMAAT